MNQIHIHDALSPSVHSLNAICTLIAESNSKNLSIDSDALYYLLASVFDPLHEILTIVESIDCQITFPSKEVSDLPTIESRKSRQRSEQHELEAIP